MSKLLLPFALSLTLFVGFTSAVRADDDDWEDYQEDREEYFEDLREAQEEAHEDWREQQEELADDRRHFYRHNYSPRQIVQRHWYSQSPSYGYGYGGYGGYGNVRVQSFYRPPVYQHPAYGVGFGPSGPAYVPYGGFYYVPRHCR